jgi:hypothetical protein
MTRPLERWDPNGQPERKLPQLSKPHDWSRTKHKFIAKGDLEASIF